MNISELIERLEALKFAHGDLPVYICSYSGTESIGEIEHCEAEEERQKRFPNDEVMPEMIMMQG